MLGDTPMMRETIARLASTGTHVLDVEVLRLRPDSRMDDALRILDAGVRLQARGVLVICHAALTGLLAKADQASDQADAW